MNEVSRRTACEALRVLSDADDQRRLWLSDGFSGADVSSFTETVAQLFDDTGLIDELSNERNSLPAELVAILLHLDWAIDRVDARGSVQSLIDDPAMEDVRQIAARALRTMRASPSGG
jgi:hypothetical protein